MEHKHAEPINKWKFVTRRVSKKEHVININRTTESGFSSHRIKALHSLLSLTLTLLLSVMMMMMMTTTLDIICDERGQCSSQVVT